MSEPEEDFATLFAASVKPKQFEKGQTIEGRIVGIGPEVAFVDVGGKGEAVIEVAELKDADGALEVKVGDRLQATVVSTSGGITLSRKLSRKAAGDRQLAAAFESGLPVEGKVERVIKGGYEVHIGTSRAFCPFSQIETTRTADPQAHVGRVYTFRIAEYNTEGRNLVVSRRALLESEQQARADQVRTTVVPGAILPGRVISVRDYGAFVDLGANVQGLLHVSDIGWSRGANATALLTPGDAVTVKVLRVDEATGKIALGLKQLTEDPWLRVQGSYEVGQVCTGQVTRVTEFGAFVELEPGIEGLAHVSSFPATGQRGGWKATVPAGTTAPFEVVSIDPAQKRIGLAPVGGAASGGAGTVSPDSEEAADVRDYTERADAASAEAFGSLADKLRGALKK
jgi:small subunit ribosomal protein S1